MYACNFLHIGIFLNNIYISSNFIEFWVPERWENVLLKLMADLWFTESHYSFTFFENSIFLKCFKNFEWYIKKAFNK